MELFRRLQASVAALLDPSIGRLQSSLWTSLHPYLYPTSQCYQLLQYGETQCCGAILCLPRQSKEIMELFRRLQTCLSHLLYPIRCLQYSLATFLSKPLSILLYPHPPSSTQSEYFLTTVICAETKSARLPQVDRYHDTEITFLHQKVVSYDGVKYHGDKYVTATVRHPYTVSYGNINVRLSDVKQFFDRLNYKLYFAEILADYASVPEDKINAVIEKIFEVVKVAVPGHNILVYMLDMRSELPERPAGLSLLLTPDDTNQRIVDRNATPMFESARNPAPVSVLGHLERVRIDSLETSIRKMPCAVCGEDLNHFAVEEEGTDDHPLMITRLLCSHLYHGDCIDQRLKGKSQCPQCGQTVKEISGSQHLFFMAAGGLTFRGYVCI